jgi:hypothetical protein
MKSSISSAIQCSERNRSSNKDTPMDDKWADKLAIQELCSRYCQTIDAQDSNGWAQCFVAEGAFEFDGHVVRGHAALRAYAEAHTRVMRARQGHRDAWMTRVK